MSRLRSLALITAFVGNALFLTDKACSQDAPFPYYTDEQRERIYAKLTQAEAAKNPVARVIETPDSIPPRTLDLDAVDVWHRKGWDLPEILARCEEEKLTGICYDGYQGEFYYVDIKDLTALEKNYDSLHRLLDLPYETSIHLNRYRRYPLITNTDGVEATLHMRLDMLELFSLDNLIAMQGHEAAHTYYRHLEFSSENPRQSKQHLISKKGRKTSSCEEEYASDSVAVTLYGPQFIDALYALFGAFKGGKGEEKVDFHYGPGSSHPDLGLRVQYAEALLRYLENGKALKKPDHPPVLKNWQPSPYAGR